MRPFRRSGPAAPIIQLYIVRSHLELWHGALLDAGDALGTFTAEASVLSTIAELAARLDRPDWSARVADKISRRRGEYLTSGAWQIDGPADRAHAQCLLTFGRATEAIAPARAAVELDQQFRALASELRNAYVARVALLAAGDREAATT